MTDEREQITGCGSDDTEGGWNRKENPSPRSLEEALDIPAPSEAPPTCGMPAAISRKAPAGTERR